MSNVIVEFDSEIEELLGEDVLEMTADDVLAVIGIVEESEELPVPVETYKAVVFDFITKLTEIGAEESGGEEEEEE